MRKLLLITRAFPPQNVVGAIRPLKFARYLPEYGWKPIVLTVKDGKSWVAGTDPSLTKELPPDIKIVRTRTIEPPYSPLSRIAGEAAPASTPWYKPFLRTFRTLFLVPDDKIGWLPFALLAGARALREEAVDLIMATSPPPTALLVGMILSATYRVPLVSDFRDPWTEFTLHEWLSNRRRRRIEEFLEHTVLKRSARIINVTPPRTDALAAKYPGIPRERFVTITNGFDLCDYGQPEPPPRNDRLTMVYTGSFYYDRQPTVFLDALAEAIEHHPAIRADLRIVFAGGGEDALDAGIIERALGDVIHTAGYLPYKESVALQKRADVLLLFLGPSRISETWYPAKLFEYIATGRPVLAMVPNSAAARLLREAGTGVIVDPTDRNSIRDCLLDLHKRWRNDSLPTLTDVTFPMQFERQLLTQTLAEVLNPLVSEPFAGDSN